MTLTGKIIEIGDLNIPSMKGMEPQSGLVILIPSEQLAAMKENLLYAKVKIELVKE